MKRFDHTINEAVAETKIGAYKIKREKSSTHGKKN